MRLTIPQNIRVIALYYSRVTLARLTELLDLPPITTERTLCKLVTDKTIYARIDRPAGVVTFKQKTNPTDVLNSWATDIDKMLGLVEKTSHLVSKVSLCDPPLRKRAHELIRLGVRYARGYQGKEGRDQGLIEQRGK